MCLHTKTVMFADDDMIQNRDADNFSGLLQSFGHLDILITRAGISTRVIVCHNDRCRPIFNGILTNFSRVYDR